MQRPWFRSSNGHLIVFYDFKVSAPPSYHAVYFAGEVERIIRRKKISSLTIVIVPDDNKLLVSRKSREKNELPDEENHEWRLRNLVISSFSLLTIRPEIFICRTRKRAAQILRYLPGQVYPQNYTVRFPDRVEKGTVLKQRLSREIRGLLRVSEAALLNASKWFEERKCFNKKISLTLRESSFSHSRNSDRKEFIKIALYLKGLGFSPFFIPDTESIEVDELESAAPVFHSAAWCFELRAAAMQISQLNVLGNNGPAVLPLYLPDCNYMSFGFIDAASKFDLKWQMDYFGLNESLEGKYLGPGHSLVAEPVSLERFKRELNNFIDNKWVKP